MSPKTAQKHQQAKLFLDSLGIRGPVSLLLRAISWFETRYAQGWGKPVHNWGAITAGPTWRGATFIYTDPKYGETLDSPESMQRFRAYSDDEEGVRDLLSLLERQHPESLKMAREGKWEHVSEALYRSGYFGGRKATAEENIRDHANAFLRTINDIVESTKEKTYLVGTSSGGASSGAGILVASTVAIIAVGLFLSTTKGKWNGSRFFQRLGTL